MSRGKKQSPFIGRRVHEVEDGVPILYPRYSKVDELLAVASTVTPSSAGSGAAAGAPEASAKKAKRAQQSQAEGGDGGQGVAPAASAAEAAEPPPKRSRKDKAAKRDAAGVTAAAEAAAPPDEVPQPPAGKHRKNKQAKAAAAAAELAAAAAGAAPGGGAPVAGNPPAAAAAAAAQRDVPASVSGSANAEEAAAMRQVLGFTATSSRAAQAFSFGFSLADQVEADTQAKLQRMHILDSADKDGYIPRRVFVGGMPYHYDEETIREYWGYCGAIEALDLLTFPDTGRFRGIAFITFATQEGYQTALACDGEQLEGHTLKVEKCKAATAARHRARVAAGGGADGGAAGAAGASSAPPSGDPAKVPGYNVAYVGNIAFEATAQEVQAVFEGCGVTRVRLHTDRDTGRSKGFAHVHFRDEAGVDRAVGERNGAELHGRALRVSYAQPKPGA